MITNFEHKTKPFTFKELNFYIPLITEILKSKTGKESVISTPELIAKIQKEEERINLIEAKKVDSVRIRMMVRYIIVNNLIPGLIGAGKGFYIATEAQQMEMCIKSLEERENAIRTKRIAILRQMKNIFYPQVTLFEQC